MPTVYTIGHSNQPLADFMNLLDQRNVQCIVDTRSHPRSVFGYFNRNPLEARLKESGIDYLYLGDQLGGHPDLDELYEGGRVVYERLAAQSGFKRGIDRVVEESDRRCLSLMCTEENPVECHRHPLLARMLVERGIEVLHIRRDGSVQDATTLVEQADPRMPLFELDGEDRKWVSPKQIRPRRRR